MKRAAGHGEHSPEGEMVWRVKILVTNNTGRRLRDLVVSLIPPQQRTDLPPLGQRPPEVLDSDRWSLDLIGPSDEHGGMPPFETAVEFELDGWRWKRWSWLDDPDLVREPSPPER